MQKRNSEHAATPAPAPAPAPAPSKIPTPSMRTVYIDFAKRYSRLIMLHFMITCALLFTFYPILNFFWTYFADEEREVETLLQYITDESSTSDGIFYHLRKMKWLGIPAFTIEAMTCLLSTIVASVFTAIWFQKYEELNAKSNAKKQLINHYT